MNKPCVSLLAAAPLALMPLMPLSALAQTAATGPAPVASATKTVKPATRLLTPAEIRESATLPGELRPEGPATPQLSIPLGNTTAKPSSPTAKQGKNGSSGGVNDAVARCNAEADESARAKCRDRLAQPAAKP